MKRSLFTLAILLAAGTQMAQAQDDMYFTKSEMKKVVKPSLPPVRVRDISVDDYNMRGVAAHASEYQRLVGDSVVGDVIVGEVDSTYIYDGEDYSITRHMSRFDNPVNVNIYVNDWYDPWYDPWFDPWFGPSWSYYSWYPGYRYNRWGYNYAYSYHWGFPYYGYPMGWGYNDYFFTYPYYDYGHIGGGHHHSGHSLALSRRSGGHQPFGGQAARKDLNRTHDSNRLAANRNNASRVVRNENNNRSTYNSNVNRSMNNSSFGRSGSSSSYSGGGGGTRGGGGGSFGGGARTGGRR